MTPAHSHEDDLIIEAAFWLRALEDGEADTEAFEAWLARDARHRAAFETAFAGWAALDDVNPANLPPRRAANETATRRNLMLGALAACAGLTVFGVWRLTQPKPLNLTTGVNGLHSVTLADGSEVTLDANTRLSVVMTRRARRIDLMAGRAWFKVAKDAARPFTVRDAQVEVTALGTEFSVEHRDGVSRVVLAEGRVVVTPGADSWRRELAPGQGVVLTNADLAPTVRQVDLDAALGWRSGQLFFDDASLAEVVARMNDYLATPLRIEGTQTARLRVTGVFAAGQARPFVTALHAYYGVEARTMPDAIVLSLGRASDAG